MILRLRFQVGFVRASLWHRDGHRKLWDLASNGSRHGCSGGKAGSMEEMVSVPSSQELPLFLRSVDLAQADLDRSVGLVFIESSGHWKRSEDVRVTRIACLAKIKAGKSTKISLIVDMLRPGVKGLVTHEGTYCPTQGCRPCVWSSRSLGSLGGALDRVTALG